MALGRLVLCGVSTLKLNRLDTFLLACDRNAPCRRGRWCQHGRDFSIVPTRGLNRRVRSWLLVKESGEVVHAVRARSGWMKTGVKTTTLAAADRSDGADDRVLAVRGGGPGDLRRPGAAGAAVSGPDQRQRSVDFRFVCAARLGSGRGGRLVPGPGFGGPLRGLPDRQVDSSRAGQTAGIDIVICWPQHPHPRPRSRIEAA